MLFNAQLSATAAAAFSAFIAGIVLQFLVRLATDDGLADHPKLVPAFVVLSLDLLVLLVSAYMFVLIVGRVPQGAAQLPDKGAAGMFAIAGSLLAVGAVGSYATVHLIVEASRKQILDLVRGILTIALGAVGLFLLLGYLDIRRVYYGGQAGWMWWLAHVALLVIPAILGYVRGISSKATSDRTGATPTPSHVRLTMVLAAAVTVLPIFVFLVISHHTFGQGAGWVWGHALTCGCALWAGCCFGGLLAATKSP